MNINNCVNLTITKPAAKFWLSFSVSFVRYQVVIDKAKYLRMSKTSGKKEFISSNHEKIECNSWQT